MASTSGDWVAITYVWWPGAPDCELVGGRSRQEVGSAVKGMGATSPASGMTAPRVRVPGAVGLTGPVSGITWRPARGSLGAVGPWAPRCRFSVERDHRQGLFRQMSNRPPRGPESCARSTSCGRARGPCPGPKDEAEQAKANGTPARLTTATRTCAKRKWGGATRAGEAILAPQGIHPPRSSSGVRPQCRRWQEDLPSAHHPVRGAG